MKKQVALFLAFILLFSGITALASEVTVFAPDGRQVAIPAEEAETYLNLGWYGTYEETVQTLYAPDGRQITVYLSEVPAYCQVGWYEKMEDTVVTVYAADGRNMQIFKAELPAYLAVGWYASYEETVQTLYAPDGRNMVVYKNEVPVYTELGWYQNYEDTVQTLYASGGRTIKVYKAEVPTYTMLGWSERPVTGPVVALTFDDGPHGVHTNSILNTLAQYGVKATFFTLGSQVAAYPSVVRRAYAEGHEIGSHSYSHPNLNTCSASTVQSEISRTVSALQNAIGAGPTLFRPPYGNHNATVRSKVGVPVILWNVDTLDWKSRNAQKVAEHVLSHASDGDIILMHDIYGSTAEAVSIFVPELLRRGFRLVTVSQLATEKGQALGAGTVHYGF